MSAASALPALVTTMLGFGPLGIGAVALVEKMLPVVPSYLVLIVLGITTVSGQGDLVVAVVAATAGSTVGALWWYGLGLALGSKRMDALIERFGRFIFLKPLLYRKMAGAYRRNHFWVTVAGQTIPVVRVYLSIPAGVLGLALLNFVTATFLGSLIWNAPLLTLGYVLRGSGADAGSLGLGLVAGLAAFEAIVLCVWRFGRGHRGPRPGRAPVEIVGGVR
jgi:membrane protein DedA with SNARE-associated domain